MPRRPLSDATMSLTSNCVADIWALVILLFVVLIGRSHSLSTPHRDRISHNDGRMAPL